MVVVGPGVDLSFFDRKLEIECIVFVFTDVCMPPLRINGANKSAIMMQLNYCNEKPSILFTHFCHGVAVR